MVSEEGRSDERRHHRTAGRAPGAGPAGHGRARPPSRRPAAPGYPPAVRTTPARRTGRRPRRAGRALRQAHRDAAAQPGGDPHRCGQRTTLRAAAGVLRTVPGQAAEVFRLLLPARRRVAGAGRGGHAASVWRARRTGRRPVDPGTGLRLGFADLVDGRTLSRRADHRRIQLPSAARAHPGAVPQARTVQRARAHLRRQRAGTGRRAVRPLRVDRDVRAHAQLRDPAAAHRQLAAAGRQIVRAHLRAQDRDVSVRDRRRRQLDGPALLHRRPDAGLGHPAVVPVGAEHRAALACRRHALPAHCQPLAGQPGRPPRTGA